MIEIFVPGVPRPQGSKRAFAHPHGGRPMIVEDAKRVKPWRSDVRTIAIAVCEVPLERDCPVRVEIVFQFARPKSHIGTRGLTATGRRKPRPTGKPDVDKLARAILDALTGVAFVDDSQVVELRASKSWAVRAGAWIWISDARESNSDTDDKTYEGRAWGSA